MVGKLLCYPTCTHDDMAIAGPQKVIIAEPCNLHLQLICHFQTQSSPPSTTIAIPTKPSHPLNTTKPSPTATQTTQYQYVQATKNYTKWYILSEYEAEEIAETGIRVAKRFSKGRMGEKEINSGVESLWE